MAFRSKSPERVFNELARDVRRHRVLDVVMVDNIMDNAYVGSLLPQLAAADWDLRIHYEVKSNLRRRDLEAMRGAGVVHIQPGIESLSTRVLGLMGKGVDATTNVGVLRDCEELSITASWNYLYGFPAEEDSDYLSVIERMPDLYHLQPPDGTTRIVLERFSPYHRDPELGFAIRRPASFYRHVYDLPDRELRDLVYAFDTPTAGITSDVEGALLEATDVWHDAYPTSTLTCQRVGDELVITDRRAHRAPADHVLDEEWQVACYGLLERGRGAASLARALRERELEPPSPETLADWLASLQERGLVFPDGDRFVALATSGVPQRARVAASP
jgi:ribosomal peptide maturation radical SAM protein 1